MSCLVSKMINGKTEITFVPSPQMYAFAMARALPPNADKKDTDVMETVGMVGQTLYKWRQDYNPHFDEWLEGYLITHTSKKMLKAMLESVGVQKALEGEFNYWKVLALREKVIQPESFNLNVVPIDLGRIGEMNDIELEAAKQTLLESLRTPRDTGESGVDGAPEEKGPKSNSARADQV